MKKTEYLKPAIVAITMNGRQNFLDTSPSGTNLTDLDVDPTPTEDEGHARKNDYVNWDEGNED